MNSFQFTTKSYLKTHFHSTKGVKRQNQLIFNSDIIPLTPLFIILSHCIVDITFVSVEYLIVVKRT